MTDSFYINDCGLLISLISTPRGMDSESFYKQEIYNNLFSTYQKKRSTIQQNFQNELYSPIGYKTFGNHDLAIISLFDDYSYPNSVFHPAHGNRKKHSKFYNYEYQVLTCLNTCQSESDKNNGKHIKNLIKNENKLNNYPIICITRLKINNFLLIGNGIYIIESIKNRIQELNKIYSSSSTLFVLDNLGSDELVVIMYSTNFSSVAEITHKIRHIKVKELNPEEASYIINNRLKIDLSDECVDWNCAHVFSSSHSTPGYKINSIIESEFTEENENLSINIDFKWDIKPGHSNNFENDFHKMIEGNGFKKDKYIDTEPFRLNYSSWQFSLDYSDMVKEKNKREIFTIIENFRNFDIDQLHTRKLSMKMTVKDCNRKILDSTKDNILINNHPKSHTYCEKIKFNNVELDNLRSSLEKSKVSKLLEEKIMKMYNNYNSCIIDPMYFSNFVDLYGFLRSFITQIKDFADNKEIKSSFKFHEWLNQYVTSFDQAYYNRFHQSNRTRNMTDYNIEWNGGIQQMISPIDFIYKQILFNLGLKQYDKFVHVSGYERVHVTQHTFRINMLHITYPELFASTIWKEVFNFYWRDKTNSDPSFYNFQSSNFIPHIKYCIERHCDFERSNEVHQFLYNSIDDQFVNSFIADTLSYYYGYNEEYDSFSYWYWRILLQSPMYYDKTGKLNPDIFTSFLCRMLFIRCLEDNNNEELEKLRFSPADTTLSELWLNNFESVRSFTIILKEILDWSDFRKLFKTFAINLMEQDLKYLLKEEELKKDKEYWSFIYTNRKIIYNNKKNELLKKFEKGEIIRSDISADSNLFILSLFASFLSFLKKTDGGNNKKTHVLQRDENGEPVTENIKNCYSNVLSDPLGGIFCVDQVAQKKCYEARTLFYRLIFDYCMINKKNQIDFFINNKE